MQVSSSTVFATDTPAEARTKKFARLAVGLAVLLFLALGLPQTWRPFHSDEVEFVRLATSLVEHGSHRIDRGFIDDVVENGQIQDWNFHPPLYTWLLGIALKITGVSEFTVRGFGLACGVLSLGLIFGIGRLIWQDHPQREVRSAFAVLFCAVNPFFIQGCLMVDIDGTVYPTLFLLLLYLTFRLDPGPEYRRLALLALVFAITLFAKMTTILVFPVVLGAYHAVRGEWRKAIGDGLAIGVGGMLLFLVGYRAYAGAAGLDFDELFTHTGRSGTRVNVSFHALRLLVFILPIAFMGGVLGRNDAQFKQVRLLGMSLVALGLASLYAFNVFHPSAKIWINWRIFLTSYFLITVPFITPTLLGLYYATIATQAQSWIARRFDKIDLVLGFTAAVLITYIGTLTRGGTFSYYQAPVIPLVAIAAAHILVRGMPHLPVGRHGVIAVVAIVLLSFAYGVFVIGDSYFLAKYRLFDVTNRELFADIVRWWAVEHIDDPSARRTLGNYLGYQPFGLAGIWYALALIPVLAVGWMFRRRSPLARIGPTIGFAAVTAGAGLGLSASQARAGYRTALNYGSDATATKQMAAYINENVRLGPYFLAPRGLSYYLNQTGYIDDTRFFRGYKGRTSPAFNANGELTLQVDETQGGPDALPRSALHYAIGNFPPLDQQPSYRVVKQFGELKLYEFNGASEARRN